MAVRRKKDQTRLCRQLRDLGYGQAESETPGTFAKCFHPVAEHVRAFDPDVALVVGERGTGKSALFRAVFDNGLLPALVRHARDPRLPSGAPERIVWIQAYPLHRDFPDPLGLRRCLGDDPEPALKLWLAYLVRALKEHLDEGADDSLRRIWELPGGAPQKVLEAFDAAEDAPLLALDRLDQRLEAEDRWIFAGYDELDTLGGYDWRAMRQALLGLIGFWAGYTRRWRRLRGKLFLRTDLFRRHAHFGGADLAKLAANRAELTWSDRNLFAMLIKRIANTDEELLTYCRGAKITFVKPEDPDLGHVPKLADEQEARPLIERMVGQFMGATAKKGRTFSWILDHLRDARGHVAPRNLVRLIEQSAAKEQVNARVRPPQLLHPTALRQALEDVSADHVRQGINNEWPWLHGVRERIQGHLMPMKQTDFRDLLAAGWEGSWSSDASIRPPVDSAKDLVDYLLELGVLRERTHGRVDLPDIYLYGLGLKRKGGVSTKN